MAQNLIIDGIVYNGVDSISMTNENGEKTTWIEKRNIGTGVAVAKIGENEYFTVEDALASAVSGDTVTMIANAIETDTYLFVKHNIKLNLAGYSLTANGLIAFNGADVFDSTDNKVKEGSYLSRLIVPKGELILPATNSEVSFWDNINHNYIFLTPNTSGSSYQNLDNITSEGFRFVFRPGFGYLDENSIRSTYLTNGARDNEITIKAEVSWIDASGNKISQVYTYDDEVIAKYYTSGALALNMTVGEKVVYVRAIVESDTGVVFEGETLTYTKPSE